MFIPLNEIRVASPCQADWNAMTPLEDDEFGAARVRFCSGCRKNVYNLSLMTRDEAQQLIAQNEGRLCVRFYRREDGTMLTQDCPVGLLRADARLKGNLPNLFLFAGLSAILAVFALGGCAPDTNYGSGGHALMGDIAVAVPNATPETPIIMGEMIAPTPAPVPDSTASTPTELCPAPNENEPAPNGVIMGKIQVEMQPDAPVANAPVRVEAHS